MRDFLYSRIKLNSNEIKKLNAGLVEIQKQIAGFSKNDGSYQSDKNIAPLEDSRYSLFVINVLEDLTQDLIFSYQENCGLRAVSKIYENISDIEKTWEFVTK